MINSRSLNEATILAGACLLLGLRFGSPAEAQSKESYTGAGAGASSARSSDEPVRSVNLPASASGGHNAQDHVPNAPTVSRDTLMTAASLHIRLATLFECLGRDDRAQAQLLEVIAIHERLSGEDHPSIIVDLTRLGAVQYRSGRYNDAGQTFSRALSIAERTFGPAQQDVAPVLASEGNSDSELERCSAVIRKLHAVITQRSHAAPRTLDAWSQPPFR